MRILLIILGTLFVGIAFLGVFLPLLPTTPFLLLAAGCYARSSDSLYDWLLNNKLFGQYIRSYKEGKGISIALKVFLLTLLVLTIGYSIFQVVPNMYGKIFLIMTAIGVSAHVFFLPTLKIEKSADKTWGRI